ncbi:MAG: hypothetical protein CMO80_06675 [Verrucomicrobiales bacterium]|nr:hypothetical protein [Verrucomicrobiales bacterium]|tara:strand:+ start:2608 stop:3762 length:1155 start_codon:yes stop_codon:yes gene_type:complete
MKKLLSLILPLVVIGGALFAAKVMIDNRKEPPRSETVDPTPVVKTLIIKPQRVDPKIEAYGEVTAHREVVIQAQVTGLTVGIDDRLIVGGRFQTGEELIRIQPIDFKLMVDQREADQVQASVQLEQEKGRQLVAKREWAMLGDKQPKDEASRRLALRAPQLRQAEFALKAADSALERAKLDLARTVIRAPFNATVISESAEMGQLVSALGQVCRLVCTDDFYVIAAVPLRLARDIRALEEDGDGATVRVHLGDGRFRDGRVIRFLADLEANSRMARVVVEVKDPLALEESNKGKGKLFIGSFVKVEIEVPTVEQAIRLPRAHARAGDTVWVLNDGKLQIRKLQIRYRETDHLVVGGGLQEGEQLIVSSLPVATDGMEVRVEAEE